MHAVLMGILGFVAGAVIAVTALLLGYIVFLAITDYHDFEGATAMGLAAVSPVVGLVGGIVGAVLFVRIFRPRAV